MIVAAAVATASGADADTANHVESAWSKLKGPLLDAATKVCGNQKPGGEMKTWTKLINRSMHSSKPTVPWRKEAWRRRPKTTYIEVKCVTKQAVWLAMSEAPQYPPDGDFRIAKQMDCRKQDIVVKNCVCNDDGELALTKTRRRHGLSTMLGCSKLNFCGQAMSAPWGLRSLQLTPPPPPPPKKKKKKKKCLWPRLAVSKMKCSKAAGPYSIVAEMLKAAFSWRDNWQRLFSAAVWSHQTVRRASLLNLYKGNGEVLDPGNYHGLKVTDQNMKLLDFNIHEIQFSFVPGRGTTDAIFIVRQLQKHFTANDLVLIADTQ